MMSKEKSVVVKNLRMRTKLCLQISSQALLEPTNPYPTSDGHRGARPSRNNILL